MGTTTWILRRPPWPPCSGARTFPPPGCVLVFVRSVVRVYPVELTPHERHIDVVVVVLVLVLVNDVVVAVVGGGVVGVVIRFRCCWETWECAGRW